MILASMIILDTNVLSEIMRPPDVRSAAVYGWLRGQKADEVATTVITVAEIAAGVLKLPEGRRRDDLETAARRAFASLFAGRIYAFDLAAAETFGAIMAARRRSGRHDHAFDLQILAIAKSRGCAVATRNIRDFDEVGVTLINPWDHPAP
jgi:predicted nucleic acid-binding protein